MKQNKIEVKKVYKYGQLEEDCLIWGIVTTDLKEAEDGRDNFLELASLDDLLDVVGNEGEEGFFKDVILETKDGYYYHDTSKYNSEDADTWYLRIDLNNSSRSESLAIIHNET